MTTTLMLALLLAGPGGGMAAGPADPEAGAGPASMVADLSPGPSLTTLNPAGMVTMGGVAYFSGQDEAHGVELWRSDGTEAGTHLVLDLRAGPVSSTPGELTPIGGWLYFTADDGQGGVGLWRSDGTAAGTELLGRPFVSERPTQMRPAGALVVFALGTRLMVFEEGVGVHAVSEDLDLCASEGRKQGDRSVASVESGGAAYYLVGCSLSERLWRTDGTPAGTSQVAQLGSAATYEPEIVALGGTLYLTRNVAGGDGELWRSDGTPGGTSLVATTESGWLTWLTPVGSRVFFMAGYGYRLYVSDGTPAGTAFVKDLGNHRLGANLTDFNGTLLLSAHNLLWRSDGTPAGTFPLVLIPGISGIRSVGARALAYSTGYYSGAPGGLWSTDGTAAGTKRLREAHSGCGVWASRQADRYLCDPGLADLGGLVLFRGGQEFGIRIGELWRTDGTEAGTQAVLASSGGQSTWPSQLASTGERVFFTQDRSRLPPGSARRLYVSDGTSTGSRVVSEWPVLHPDGGRYQDLDGLTAFGNAALFYLLFEEPNYAVKLWHSDGTAAGTQPVWPIAYPDPAGWRFGRVPPFVWNGRAYFPGSTDVTDVSLFSTDGSTAGTELVLALRPGSWPYPAGSGPQLATAGSLLFLSSGDAESDGFPATSRALWRSDEGADPVKIAKVDVQQVVSFADQIYFIGQRSSIGSEVPDFGLWRSDGTTKGTQPITPLPKASAQLTVAGARLYFVAPDPLVAGRRTLWTSDGTAAGTQIVLPGGPLDPEGLTAVGSSLFFSALQAGTGREPWRSDATAAGTVLVKDLLPGPHGSILEGTTFTANADRVYFAAEAPGLGRELWSSDGTPTGTQPVQDIAPGPASSNPDEPRVLGSRLYFRADDGMHGAELWTLPITRARTRLAASTTLPRNAQARMGADEAEAIEALRQIGAAANGYVLANGAYPSNLRCLGDPEGGCGAFPAGTAAWLPPDLGAVQSTPGVFSPTQFQRAGYVFTYVGGSPSNSGIFDFGVNTFTLAADPIVWGATGQRYFTMDQSGRICQATDGAFPNTGDAIPPGCIEI